MRRVLVLFLILAVSLPLSALAISGCGEPTPEEAKAQLETDLESLETSLTELLNPTTYASSESFNDAADSIKKAFDDVVKSARQVADIETADLQDAWARLEKAIASDQPLPDKLVEIQDSAGEFQTAWQDLVDEVQNAK